MENNTIGEIVGKNRTDILINQGWIEHSSNSNENAEMSFRKAITLDPKSIEAFYGLALVLKAQKRKKEAIQVFEQALSFLEEKILNDPSRRSMLKRIISGHINFMKDGDWNLEKEIWQR